MTSFVMLCASLAHTGGTHLRLKRSTFGDGPPEPSTMSALRALALRRGRGSLFVRTFTHTAYSAEVSPLLAGLGSILLFALLMYGQDAVEGLFFRIVLRLSRHGDRVPSSNVQAALTPDVSLRKLALRYVFPMLMWYMLARRPRNFDSRRNWRSAQYERRLFRPWRQRSQSGQT